MPARQRIAICIRLSAFIRSIVYMDSDLYDNHSDAIEEASLVAVPVTANENLNLCTSLWDV